MRSIFLIVVALGLVVAAVAIVGLGAFPPTPHVQTVSKVLPNDRFKTK